MIKPLLVTALSAVMLPALWGQQGKWSESKARDWYAKQPWLVGANYIPATAINELEMWQAESFDLPRIEKEFEWAESIGMNTMRVFLHDLLWLQDSAAFRKRIDQFLTVASRHGIRPMFVLFDSCWDPNPRVGPQRSPTPGVHNSGWLQSPGSAALADPAQYTRLEHYVTGVVKAFANDRRILAWDIWNEPENPNTRSYGPKELKNKTELVMGLLPKAFTWARSMKPSQPLTVGVWQGDWSTHDGMTPINRAMIELSDIVSFHNYGKPDDFAERIQFLKRYNRPILCTEYMARGAGSTFESIMPIAKENAVAAINWGLVRGKTQTHLPWDSWTQPYVNREPPVWFHEVFDTDGKPYREDEVRVIRELTAKPKAKAA